MMQFSVGEIASFNIGQKNGSISGRLLEKHAFGQKNGLIYGHNRHKIYDT